MVMYECIQDCMDEHPHERRELDVEYIAFQCCISTSTVLDSLMIMNDDCITLCCAIGVSQLSFTRVTLKLLQTSDKSIRKPQSQYAT